MRPSLAAVLLCLLLPAPADAEPVAGAGPLLGGPRIVDDGVAWMERTDDGYAVRATRAGAVLTAYEEETYLADADPYDDDDTATVPFGSVGDFAAAGSASVLEQFTTGGNPKGPDRSSSSQVREIALERGADALLLTACDRSTGDDSIPADLRARVATDGRAIAVNQCSTTKIFDAASNAEVAAFQGDLDRIVLAGRYLAYRLGSAVVVRDWQAGSEAYRVPVQGSPQALAFDVQEDGALALAVFAQEPRCGGAALTWHTPETPAGVPLPAAPCAAEVAVDGGRAVTVAEAPGGGGQVIAEVAPDGMRRDIAWLGTGRGRSGDVDYRAGSATYALERCAGGATIHRSAGSAAPQRVDCPGVTFRATRRRTGPIQVRGRLRVQAPVRLTVTYRTAGRTLRRTVRARDGRFAFRLRPPARARRRAGRLAIAYRGDTVHLPETVRRRVR